jgi:hypothetical protein
VRLHNVTNLCSHGHKFLSNLSSPYIPLVKNSRRHNLPSQSTRPPPSSTRRFAPRRNQTVQHLPCSANHPQKKSGIIITGICMQWTSYNATYQDTILGSCPVDVTLYNDIMKRVTSRGQDPSSNHEQLIMRQPKRRRTRRGHQWRHEGINKLHHDSTQWEHGVRHKATRNIVQEHNPSEPYNN